MERNESGFEPCFQFPEDNFQQVPSDIPYLFNAAFNVFLSFFAVVSNTLVFLAVRKTAHLRLPFKILLGNLILTDIGIGLFVQPTFAVFLFTKAKGFSAQILCVNRSATAVGSTALVCVSMTTMTLISLDRYIAFRHHFRYHQIITVKRVVITVSLVWISSVVLAVSLLWNLSHSQNIAIIELFVCLVVTSTSYFKISSGLRQRYGASCMATIRAKKRNKKNVTNVPMYKRTAWTMLKIYCLAILCYVPLVCMALVMKSPARSVLMRCIFEFAVTITFFNSCLNPIVYCWCLHYIRAVVRKTLTRRFHRSRR